MNRISAKKRIMMYLIMMGVVVGLFSLVVIFFWDFMKLLDYIG